jgi:antitoxin ParD1/3/4
MSKAVQVTLGEPFGSFVDSEVQSGRFTSPEEVVEAGLRLLEQEKAKLDKLRELLIESENTGPAEIFDRDALMVSVRASWEERG